MKKKTISIILALIMTVSLLVSACGEIEKTEPSAVPTETEPVTALEETPEETPETGSAETEGWTWEVEPAPIQAPANAVQVNNVDSFLVAIGPNTTIVLAPGVYDLTTASDYGNTKKTGGCYRWEDSYDGYELAIEGVDNLWILAPEGAEIQAVSRYANVLRFLSCDDLALAGLTLGHTQEPGVCSGGVLDLSECNRVRLESCQFYGCGTVGIHTYACRDLVASFCQIYDCSYAAVYANLSREMRLEDCWIHDCGDGKYDACPSLIQAYSCRGLALVNTRIAGNSANTLFDIEQSFDVALLGCQAEDNRIQLVFGPMDHPVLVENCGFEISRGARFYAEHGAQFAQDRDGNDLISFDLSRMQRRRAEFEGFKDLHIAEPQLDVTLREDGTREVKVSSVDELLAAIAPNTTVILAPGDYDLSTANDYGASVSEWYSWESCYDGFGLVLSGVDNFCLEGAGKENTRILAEPRYADVLKFVDCRFPTLSGFTAGHTDGESACGGDVLEFSTCSGVEISGCGCFGCGMVGLVAYYCESIHVGDTELYACTGNGADFTGCISVEMNNCSIFDCRDNRNLIYVSDSRVVFDGIVLSEGIHRFDHHSYVGLENVG